MDDDEEEEDDEHVELMIMKLMMMLTLMMGETVSGARGDTPRTPHDDDDAHVDDG